MEMMKGRAVFSEDEILRVADVFLSWYDNGSWSVGEPVMTPMGTLEWVSRVDEDGSVLKTSGGGYFAARECVRP